ncbi:hypothetical protein D3OALGA1CA_218 [Olavius algarvensis associated proteobacterium Delta 3]|nr:hypothetical protein D3OALGA1CA_218 [Olavius algarvensis associated proteobacterium Delta 3]CAB5156487.1 hypothetical protein D3OALGB2SA_5139 [Olavius algarvensis associated proteobacterium Delta 3]
MPVGQFAGSPIGQRHYQRILIVPVFVRQRFSSISLSGILAK